jgi:hypothetical protein
LQRAGTFETASAFICLENIMTATPHILPARRELAHRRNGGIDIYLLWSPADDTLAVSVLDPAGGSFELVVEAAEALEVFDHPFAYAEQRGVRPVAQIAA